MIVDERQMIENSLYILNNNQKDLLESSISLFDKIEMIRMKEIDIEKDEQRKLDNIYKSKQNPSDKRGTQRRSSIFSIGFNQFAKNSTPSLRSTLKSAATLKENKNKD